MVQVQTDCGARPVNWLFDMVLHVKIGYGQRRENFWWVVSWTELFRRKESKEGVGTEDESVKLY